MENQMKRVQWIDIVKYVCIMWVMLSHLESKTRFLEAFYHQFYLIGFLFASGYVYHHKRGFKQFFVKKVRGLFIPWLFFSVFNILLAHVASFNEHSTLSEELKWNFLQIRGKGDVIWFVAALFVAYMPFYFFIDQYENRSKQKNRKTFLFIAFVLAFICDLYGQYMNPNLLPWGSYRLPWHIEYIFFAMFWMVLGYLFRNEYEKEYNERIKIKSVIVAFSLYILMSFLPLLMGYVIKNNILQILYSYVTSMLAIFVLIYFSKNISTNKYFLYIGQNTLVCFALHGKIYSIIQTILKKTVGSIYADILANTVSSSIFAIIFTFVLSYILIIPIYVINRWFPFLIGRKLKKQNGI